MNSQKSSYLSLWQQFSTCELWPLWGIKGTFQRLHVRYPAYQDTYTMIHNNSQIAKLQSWNSNKNNLMVGGQHNIRYNIKGLRIRKGENHWSHWVLNYRWEALYPAKIFFKKTLLAINWFEKQNAWSTELMTVPKKYYFSKLNFKL